MQIKYIQVLLIFLTTIIISGCVTSGYKKPIEKFQKASLVVINSSKTYIIEINKVKRDEYIDSKTNNLEEIDFDQIKANKVIPDEYIKYLVKTLDQLTKYNTLLLKLATSSSPDKITSSAEDLKTSLILVSTDISKIAGVKDKAFTKAVGPATALMGEVARLIIEHKIDSALKEAINGNEEIIYTLIDGIGIDVDIGYNEWLEALRGKRTILNDRYKAELKKICGAIPCNNKTKTSTTRLEKISEDLKTLNNKLILLESNNPEKGVALMKNAHKALVEFAKSNKNTRSISDFAAAMEAYSLKAKRIGAAVEKLKSI